MVVELAGINWFSILIAGMASFLLGGMWFAGIFARCYALALGREHETRQAPAPLYLAGPFVCGMVTAAASGVLMHVLKVQTLGDAVGYGTLVGIGFLASTTVNTGINPNIPRPLLYGLISGSYFLVSSILVSVIVVSMR
jgi:hypothetical protein